MLRQPIVTIMGHVDHGKTSLLDKIRGTAIAAKEAGGITQAIGASIIPLSTLKAVCGQLLQALKLTVTVPGLLFIDTPGHAVFTNLRKRGGNLADIAIVVIDIREGIMPQTEESIHILKTYKTPFVIAVNKVDLLEQWHTHEGKSLLQSVALQEQRTTILFETKMYELVGKLHELGLPAERFDRVDDYTKQVALIPMSAKTGQGIPELLAVLTALAQKYLEQQLGTDAAGQAKGTVLEVKEEKGLGTVMDVILYDGTLRVNQNIVIGGIEQPIVTKIRSLLVPAVLGEMRDKKTKFQQVKEVTAATGVRISAPLLENAIAGVPLVSVDARLADAKRQVQREVDEVLVATDAEGVVIKADTLGSLEALSKLLHDKNIPVKRAGVGSVSKKDLSDAEACLHTNRDHAIILGFNIPQPVETGAVKVITANVIYRLLEEYELWVAEQHKRSQTVQLGVLVKPAKIQLLAGYVFRQSGPAVLGAEVLRGVLVPGTPLMKKDGVTVTTLKEIQHEQKTVPEAKAGMRVAVALPGVIVGRQIKEGDILYSAVSESDFRQYKVLKATLSMDERELLKEIASLMRENNPVWGC